MNNITENFLQNIWTATKISTIIFGIGLGFIVVFTNLVNMPTVYESYSTGECVWVDSHNDEFSCDNLPPKYTRTWVK